MGCWHVWSRNGFDELPKGFLVALENDLALMSIHLTIGKKAHRTKECINCVE